LRLGWLGDLTEVAALLGGSLAWEQALALPVGEPEIAWDLSRIPSADALRWAAFAGVTPDQAERTFLRPLWQAAVSLLSQADAPKEQDRDDGLLDRWVAARLNQAIDAVTQALDVPDSCRAAEELANLVRDLTDWAVPYRAGSGRGTLEPLSRLLAPFVPHLAEAIHRQSKGLAAPSVHLASWPSAGSWQEAQPILDGLAHVQRWAELGKSARAQAGVAPDQALREAIVSLLATVPAEADQIDPFAGLLARILGVAQVQIVPEAATPVRWRLHLDPEHRVERDLPPAEIEATLAELDDEESARLASQLRAGLSAGLQVSGRAITLLPDEVSFTAQAPAGWVSASDAQHLVLLEVG
jgi:isoleucyl-tRNA synthetase